MTRITKEKYETLKEAHRKGANLAPVDFQEMGDYERNLAIQNVPAPDLVGDWEGG